MNSQLFSSKMEQFIVVLVVVLGFLKEKARKISISQCQGICSYFFYKFPVNESSKIITSLKWWHRTYCFTCSVPDSVFFIVLKRDQFREIKAKMALDQTANCGSLIA